MPRTSQKAWRSSSGTEPSQKINSYSDARSAACSIQLATRALSNSASTNRLRRSSKTGFSPALSAYPSLSTPSLIGVPIRVRPSFCAASNMGVITRRESP